MKKVSTQKQKNIIEEFTDKYKDRSMKTVENYHYVLNQYFKHIGKKPNKDYFKQNDEECKKDILDYWEIVKNQAPKTRSLKIYCIKSFLLRNGIELKTMFYRDLLESVKEKGALTQDDVLSNEDLKKILSHCNEKYKALFMVLATSGMRVGELLKLEEKDVHLDHNPPYIYLPGKITKNGYPRFSFITDETKEAVEAWRRIKPIYMEKVKAKNNFQNTEDKGFVKLVKDVDDPRLFPFAYSTIQSRWEVLASQTNLTNRDERTNRLKIHVHSLRSWAITRMENVMQKSKVDFIVGHTLYLSREYNKYKEADIAPDYQRAMGSLAIFETAPNLSGIHEDMKAKDAKIVSLEKQVAELMSYKVELMNDRLKKLEETAKVKI